MTESESDEAARDYADHTRRLNMINARFYVSVAAILLILASIAPYALGFTWGLAVGFVFTLAGSIAAYIGGVETERSHR